MPNDEIYYKKIRDVLAIRAYAVQEDNYNNLQDLAILSEGFYCQLLNILLNANLENINSSIRNNAGIDLLDSAKHILVQVSACCTYKKIQESIDKADITGEDNKIWTFYFVPIMISSPKHRKKFTCPNYISFNPKDNILDIERIMRRVQDSSVETKKQLYDFVVQFEKHESQMEKLRDYLNGLINDTWKAHPSYRLMQTDQIDQDLFPNIENPQQFKALGSSEQSTKESPVWSIIRNSWNNTENHSIVIMGNGGIGKTVALFSVNTDIEEKQHIPAIYVPVFDLIDDNGTIIDLSLYIKSLSETYGPAICELATSKWYYGPKLLILLDGFNEVSGNNRKQIVRMISKWMETHQGVQIIAVSRPMDNLDLARELPRCPISISLSPLSRNKIKEYLSKWHVSLPNSKSSVWKSLSYPLFLNLYIKTDPLKNAHTCGNYPLFVRNAEGPGAIIWNFLQRELLRGKKEVWVVRCAIACEYLFPALAHHMVQNHEIAILAKDAVELIRDMMKGLCNAELLPPHIQDIIEAWKNDQFTWNDESQNLFGINPESFDWAEFTLREVGILVPYKQNEHIVNAPLSSRDIQPQIGTRFAFMHQNFRDCLAGLYLVNQADYSTNNVLPDEWKIPPLPAVMDYAAELIPTLSAKQLWELNRQHKPTSPIATYTMMELQKRLREEKDLNWSGMDLSEICLVNYLPPKRTMHLFSKPSLSQGTQIGHTTFQSQGHNKQVTCVSVTDNHLCVTGSADNTLRVWDLFTGSCIMKLCGHSKPITCIVAIQNEIISASKDKTIRIWDIETGACKKTIQCQSGEINTIATQPNGLCAVAIDNGTIGFFNSHSTVQTISLVPLEHKYGKSIHLSFHKNRLCCISLCEDDDTRFKHHNLYRHNGVVLSLYDVTESTVISDSTIHEIKVSCISAKTAICSNNQLVTVSNSGVIRVLDIDSQEEIRSIDVADNISFLVPITSSEILAASVGGSVYICDLVTCKIKTLSVSSNICSIGGSFEGVCVSGYEDGAVSAWDIRTTEHLWSWRQLAPIATCIGITTSQEICTGHIDGTLRFWSQDSYGALKTIKAHNKSVSCISPISEGILVSGSDDGSIKVWDTNRMHCVRELKKQGVRVKAISNAENGSCLCALQDNSIILFDVFNNTSEIVQGVEPRWEISDLRIVGNGLVVTNYYDGNLRIFNYLTGEYKHTLKGHTMRVVSIAEANNEVCVSGSIDGSMIVWNTRSGSLIDKIHGSPGWIWTVAVDDDGNCAYARENGEITIWNYKTKKQVFCYGHSGRILCIKFSGNNTLISSGEDSTIRIWNVQDGICLSTLNVTEAVTKGMVFSNDTILPDELRETLLRNGASFK